MPGGGEHERRGATVSILRVLTFQAGLPGRRELRDWIGSNPAPHRVVFAEMALCRGSNIDARKRPAKARSLVAWLSCLGVEAGLEE